MIALPALGIGGNLPLGRDAAPWYVPWLVAFLACIAALSGIGFVAARDARHAMAQATQGTLTVQVPAETSEARLQTVLGVLRQAKGVTDARLLDRKEMAQLLEPWLGPAAPIAELPVPRLIDVQAAADGSLDLAALKQQLASVLPEGRLEDQGSTMADTRGAARRVEAVLAAGIALPLLLVVILTMYAVGGALVIEQEVVEVVHLLGARDSEIAGQFTGRAALIALAGGVVGAAAALGTNVVLSGSTGFLQLAGGSPVLALGDWRLWAILAGVAVVAALAAMASARITLLRRLAALP